MCGRYRLTAKERWLSTYFNLDPEDVNWTARWNVAPTQEVATIREDKNDPKRKFALMRWGLTPYWAENISFGARTFGTSREPESLCSFDHIRVRTREGGSSEVFAMLCAIVIRLFPT